MKTYLKITSTLTISMFAVSGFALTNDEVKSEKKNIETQYKSALAQCKSMSGNAKDICEKEAKGNEKIAKAELDVRVKPNDSTHYKARLARAEAAYEVAKERCDDLSGNAKDVCKKDANAAHVKAKEEAKVKRVEEAPTNKSPAAKAAEVSEARKDAVQDTREAQYKAAKERCDAMSGPDKDTCINDAKIRFGQ
ncbi:hypothetical protein G7047_08285 [Diaphorobacter sp. HDW4A]|uniref:hypothetical protein n=1 Tax=Diaphorobacter sp. HDW4A TaxID=2714924 RepID=UPI00140E00F0|nr:hypothetical protein [Diaphorobacter sp. HDW4A]QIL79904.1 hypothetical protein G7047_08285 [Diaphorobacter sp. HDW4A]